jgi:hypothetical protein
LDQLQVFALLCLRSDSYLASPETARRS